MCSDGKKEWGCDGGRQAGPKRCERRRARSGRVRRGRAVREPLMVAPGRERDRASAELAGEAPERVERHQRRGRAQAGRGD